MQAWQRKMMQAPSIPGVRCAFCGRVPIERHHIIYRSQGGTDGPTVPVCGLGNASGCHGLLHAHILHLWWDDGAQCWMWLRTPEPVKEQDALAMDGWRRLREPLPEASIWSETAYCCGSGRSAQEGGNQGSEGI